MPVLIRLSILNSTMQYRYIAASDSISLSIRIVFNTNSIPCTSADHRSHLLLRPLALLVQRTAVRPLLYHDAALVVVAVLEVLLHSM